MAEPTASLRADPINVDSRFSPDTPAERFNRRLGLVCFAIYFAMYAAFVGITVYDYRLLGRPALAGLNLAIVYGFGLIVAAFVLAVIYMVMCRKEPTDASERHPEGA